MKTKICGKCKEEKSLEFFTKDCSKKSGLRSSCKSCCGINSRDYYSLNKDKENERSRKYQKANPEKHAKHAKCSREHYAKNRTKKIQYQIEYEKRKKSIDPEFKLARLLRDRFRKALKNGYKKGSAVKDLGCSINSFKLYLEQKFQPGMNWNNQGITGWHIDHIRPLASFDLEDREQLLKALHFTNLQPLWANENLAKGAKYEENYSEN